MSLVAETMERWVSLSKELAGALEVSALNAEDRISLMQTILGPTDVAIEFRLVVKTADNPQALIVQGASVLPALCTDELLPEAARLMETTIWASVFRPTMARFREFLKQYEKHDSAAGAHTGANGHADGEPPFGSKSPGELGQGMSGPGPGDGHGGGIPLLGATPTGVSVTDAISGQQN